MLIVNIRKFMIYLKKLILINNKNKISVLENTLIYCIMSNLFLSFYLTEKIHKQH